jgi:hypothetical protein
MAWIKRRKTAERYGVSVRTIERYEANDPTFPRSTVRIGRRYDNEEKLDDWDAACAAVGRATRTPPNAGVGHRPASGDEVTA